MKRALVVLLLLLAWARPGAAYDSLFSRLPKSARASALFQSSETRASVHAGFLLGEGFERRELLPDGKLRVLQSRTYTKARHPDSRKVFALREPWRVETRLVLSSALRLISADTRLAFHRSIDASVGYAFTEEKAEFFEQDHMRVEANAAGDRLTRSTWLAGKGVKRESYDYPTDAVPMEIASFVLAAAVKNRVQQFNFDVLLPGGATHGVRSQIFRTRDVSRFTRGYSVPFKQLRFDGEYAVIEMRLASPIKRVFFPHKIYLAYASEDPATVFGLWGGDPDEPFQVVRKD